MYPVAASRHYQGVVAVSIGVSAGNPLVGRIICSVDMKSVDRLRCGAINNSARYGATYLKREVDTRGVIGRGNRDWRCLIPVIDIIIPLVNII
ncbi:hypothetical protein ES703_106507 [subsurface metagenome]